MGANWSQATSGVSSTAPTLAGADQFVASVTVDSTSLLEDPRGAGVKLAQQILSQFGLDVSDQVLVEWQAQILKN